MPGRWLLLFSALVALSGCKTRVERLCDAFSDHLSACLKDFPADSIGYANKYCVAWVDAGPRAKDDLTPCFGLTDCDQLAECLDHAGCSFIVTSPSDSVPKLQCELKR